MPTSFIFFFSSRRRHTRWTGDWSSDVCSSDLVRRKERPLNRRDDSLHALVEVRGLALDLRRSEERRVGKESRSRGAPYYLKKKNEKKKAFRAEIQYD